MTHFGDVPTLVEGLGEFVGKHYYAQFTLPDDFITDEPAIIQCQTMHSKDLSDCFFLNGIRLDNILKVDSNANDWVFNMSEIPHSLLRPGENTIHIGHTGSLNDVEYDDFNIGLIVILFKTK